MTAKNRLDSLEKQIRQRTGKNEHLPPGFFKVGDPLIDSYREDLLRQGYTLQQVNQTPIFIEE